MSGNGLAGWSTRSQTVIKDVPGKSLIIPVWLESVYVLCRLDAEGRREHCFSKRGLSAALESETDGIENTYQR